VEKMGYFSVSENELVKIDLDITRRNVMLEFASIINKLDINEHDITVKDIMRLKKIYDGVNIVMGYKKLQG
jgi:hypothetical protein